MVLTPFSGFFRRVVMKTISMDVVRKLDKVWDQQCAEFLTLVQYYRGPMPFFLSEQYIDGIDIPGMARKWGVDAEDLRTYIALRRYIAWSLDGEYRDVLPGVEIIAEQMGIPLNEFNCYLHEQQQQIEADREADEDDSTANWHDVTAEDFGDIEEDFLLDEAAAIQGE